MLPLILCLLLEAPASAAQSALERLKGSLFTVEVHSGNERAKSVQGSAAAVRARQGIPDQSPVEARAR